MNDLTVERKRNLKCSCRLSNTSVKITEWNLVLIIVEKWYLEEDTFLSPTNY
jgi:hypothetical protein